MKFTGRKILGVVLLLAVGLLALRAWWVFFTAMVTPGLSDIWQPIAWFSVLASFFFLGTVLWMVPLFRIAGAALIFLPGLFFIRSWEYILAGIFATFYIFWSSTTIARETGERVYFHFYKSVRAGAFLFVLGLSLLISSGYYVFLKNASWEEMVPRFRIGQEMTGIIFKIAGTVNPSFARLSKGDMTVDEFLLSLEESKQGATPYSQTGTETQLNEQDFLAVIPEINQCIQDKGINFSLDCGQGNTRQELFLQSGREQVATLVGRKVAGGEKISDVLSLALQNKLIALLNGGQAAEHVPSQAIPFFLAGLLFLTLLSLASILEFPCILAAQLIFMFSLRIGWLKLATISVNQERLGE